MMNRTLIACSLCLGTTLACEQRTDYGPTTSQNDVRSVEPNQARADNVEADNAQRVAADNAKRNERDRNDNAPTPMDQGNNEADIEITKKIRQQVLDQPDFSVNAQNVKIITQNGTVTLRGPVATAAEKATIERLAKAQAGANKLVSELEVKVEDKNGKE